MNNEKRKTLYIIINNHFDPMWRRCFHKGLPFKGETYVSYGDLEEYYILDNMELCRKNPEYKFQIESVIIIREFLKRHPELYEELTELAKEGRVYTPGSGEAIIDVNMVLGESIIRNYLIGMLWIEDNFGYRPKLAVRTDAFGNSAQLPQILKGCGMEWVTGLNYSVPKGKYWKGVDGSIVLHHTLPVVGSGGGWRKYAPCPECRGEKKIEGNECEYCKGRGIHREKAERDWSPIYIDENAFGQYDCGFVTVGGEEFLPNPAIIDWAEKVSEKYNVIFASEEIAFAKMEDLFKKMPDAEPEQLHNDIEVNPNNTGSLVSRIKTKQYCRRQEYELLKAETLCTLGALAGFEYPRDSINEIWLKLFYTLDHDSITGTHVDAAYEELADYWKEIDDGTSKVYQVMEDKIAAKDNGSSSVINLTGNFVTEYAKLKIRGVSADFKIIDENEKELKVLESCRVDEDITEAVVLIENLPPYTSRNVKVIAEENNKEGSTAAGESRSKVFTSLSHNKKTASVQNNILQSLPENHKILGNAGAKEEKTYTIENYRYVITANSTGLVSIYDKILCRNISESDGYRPGEFILEHDEGSPWATLEADMTRLPLSGYTELLGVEKAAGMQRFLFEVNLPQRSGYAIDAVKLGYTVTLWEGIDRIEFKADVRWDGYNQRLRVALPVPFKGLHQYEIPYGIIKREPYEPFYGWAGANGDWPAINWAGIEGSEVSVALLNKGTPSYKMETSASGKDIILLSLLRNPTLPTYLHEPDAYIMTDWDGMRDVGSHSFEFAVTAYDKPFAKSKVVNDADNYNAGLHVVSGSVKLPEMPVVLSENVRISSIKIAERSNSLIMRLVEFSGGDESVLIRLPQNIGSVSRINMLEDQAEQLEAVNGEVMLKLKAYEIVSLSMNFKY